MAVTVTRKGQVTIPKPVRDRLGINPGSKVDFEVAEDGRAFLRRVGKPAVEPSRFEGMRGTATSRLTADEIMALTRGDQPMTLVDTNVLLDIHRSIELAPRIFFCSSSTPYIRASAVGGQPGT